MTNLPRNFFLIIFVLLLLLLPLVFYFHKSVYAQDPGDVFILTVERFIKNEKEAERQEAKDGKVRVFADRVKSYDEDLIWIKTVGSILPLTTDEEYNAKRPTAIGAISDAIAMTYQYPPASGLAFTYDTLANAGLLTKPAYAQGIGFAGLAPLLPVWRASRNVAYSAIVVVMLVIGFMIVFRMKIDPKTVISVQAAIPRIVITLLLITFSYAIVGFMVDIMYLTMAIFISVMANGMGEPFKSQIAELQNQYMTGGIETLFGSIFSGGFRSLDDFFKGGYPKIFAISEGIGGFGYFWKFASTKFIPFLVGAIAIPLIFLLILTLGLLFTFIRLLMLLLNSYIQVLISLILGPIILLAEAIPGRSAFSQWILNILANLVVFPTTVAVLMFAMFLTTRNDLTPLWRPPLMAFPINPFTAFLGLGIIFMAPSLVARVKKIFRPKPIVPITAGTAISPLTGAVQTGMGAMGQFYYPMQLLPMINRLRGEPPKQ